MTTYVGRFAPSPTGPLHAGSLVAALASWLDARAWNGGRGGRWLVRIEDVDTLRCVPGAAHRILQQLADCGLQPDAAPLYQSTRHAAYQAALDTLVATGQAYPCGCTRQAIALALGQAGHTPERDHTLPYPGTCRHGLQGRAARAWRFKVPLPALQQSSNNASNWPQSLMDYAQAAMQSIAQKTPLMAADSDCLAWLDRRLGAQAQCVAKEVGDFVLLRADGYWAYQLAVVVDDAAQGVSHIVRGEDLADNTARQILLQQALGYRTPTYLHTALARDARGDKLSKQHQAPALETATPAQAVNALQQAAAHLGLPGLPAFAVSPGTISPADWLAQVVPQWARAYPSSA